MAKWLSLKDRPLAQSVVGNAIFQVLWNGASALIGWIAGHYAALRGIGPHWAILIGAAVFFLLALSYHLIWRKRQTRTNSREQEATTSKEPDNVIRELQTEIASLKSDLSKHKLTFEVDASQTQVRMSGGTQVKRIEASVRLRCFNASGSPMAVREFQASFYKQQGQREEMIVGNVNAARVWLLPNSKLDVSNGLIIKDPISPYYWFFFYLDLTPQVADTLSRDHFLRIAMNAVGQTSQVIDFYVESWANARESNSSIALKNSSIALIGEGSGLRSACPDHWLHEIAEFEKKAADTRLVVIGCNIWNRRFSEEPREIEFSFDLINCAVYPLGLKEIASAARIVFANKVLLYPPTMQVSADAYLHGNRGWFHLNQQVTEGEYQRILKAGQQCAFEFQKLSIGIKGGKGNEEAISPGTLRIPFMITLSNELFPAKH